MPKVTPSLQIAADIEQKLVNGAMRQLYFEQVRIYRQSYEQTETSTTWRVTNVNNSSEQLPNYIFDAFQLQTRYGDKETNPVVFDAGTLSRISCWVNSIRFPDRELEVSFAAASRNYGRAYMTFQEAIGKYNDTDSGSQVSVEDYASLFPIFAFNVGHHKERLRGSSADIEIRWPLSGNFGGHYHVYALVLSDRYMQLNVLNEKWMLSCRNMFVHSIIAAYCVKCRVKTGDVSPLPAMTKNGKPMIKSRCGVCGKYKSRFVKHPEVQGGSLGKLFPPLLGKITAPVVKEVAKKVIPALGMAAVTGL